MLGSISRQSIPGCSKRTSWIIAHSFFHGVRAFICVVKPFFVVTTELFSAISCCRLAKIHLSLNFSWILLRTQPVAVQRLWFGSRRDSSAWNAPRNMKSSPRSKSAGQNKKPRAKYKSTPLDRSHKKLPMLAKACIASALVATASGFSIAPTLPSTKRAVSCTTL
jgi:hypothetical protein